MSDDITFCMKDACKYKKCFRHSSNIKDRTIPHSYAMFEGTRDCPYKDKTMTTKEAITLLQTFIDGEPGTISTQDYIEALQVAIKALKEKPVEAEWLFVAEAYYDVIYVCTKCGRFFTMPKGEDNDVLRLAPYCHCGAKMIRKRAEE